MKKPSFLPLLGFAVMVCVLTLLAETFLVKVQTTPLRKEPKFYAESVTMLKAGDSLERMSEKSGWLQVKTAQGQIGWVHKTAVQEKKFKLGALDKSLQTQATADEVALASKGFNKQIEDQYKARNSRISFEWVDRMLKITVSPEQMKSFLEQGKLGDFGGPR